MGIFDKLSNSIGKGLTQTEHDLTSPFRGVGAIGSGIGSGISSVGKGIGSGLDKLGGALSGLLSPTTIIIIGGIVVVVMLNKK